MAATRREHDSLGEVEVPEDARYGAQTQRAIDNFRISGRPMPPSLIRAVAAIKAAAARANSRLGGGTLDDERAAAIQDAAEEIVRGEWADQFPIDVYQTGSGTSTNMNVNEVIAHRAAETSGLDVHPNDHVNASQSSNDVIPSAIRIAVARALRDELAPALDDLVLVIRAKASAHDDVVKSGRTHLMDAAPLFVGQEMAAWAAQISMSRVQIGAVLDVLGALPLGGSAVGTGLNVARGWGVAVIADLARSTGLPLHPAPDRFAAMAGGEAYASASALTRGVAISLTKISNDLRLLASGPRTGFAEITLPALQPGSSIMPGKVNPVIPEATLQVAARVMGNDTTVMFASSQGTLQLNTYLPVIAEALLESITLLTAVTRALAEDCIAGIEVDAEACRRYALASPALVTGLATTIGYDRAAAAVHRADHEGLDLRDVLLEDGVDAAVLDAVLQPERLARGGLVDGRDSGA